MGNDLVDLGRRWAQYLVDKGLVKAGDFVWMPVEVPGAAYGVSETQGIASVFDPLGITYEITDNTLDQAEVISRMSDYLTANREKIAAIIGLGDLVTGSIKRVFDQVGVKRARFRWSAGATRWTRPTKCWRVMSMRRCGRIHRPSAIWACRMGLMAASGIPPGFDIKTGTLYEKDTAPYYCDIMAGK